MVEVTLLLFLPETVWAGLEVVSKEQFINLFSAIKGVSLMTKSDRKGLELSDSLNNLRRL